MLRAGAVLVDSLPAGAVLAASLFLRVSTAVAAAEPAPATVAAPAPAAVDTLDVRAILEHHNAELDSLLLPASLQLDTLGITARSDSLDRGGADAAHKLRAAAARGGPATFRFEVQPFDLTTYQRVDGLRLGWGVAPRYGRALRADLTAAYGFASHDAAGRAGLEIGRSRGPFVRLGWSDLVVPFGPLPGGESLGLLAFVVGQDRQDYLRRRELEAALWVRRDERSELGLQLFDHHDFSRSASTDFNLVGGGVPMHEPNPSVDEVHVWGGVLSGRSTGNTRRSGVEAAIGVGGGDTEWAWQDARAWVAPIVAGGTLTFELAGANRAGAPPVQEAAYLGGDGNLRGYDRLEFAGKRRATTRLEYALGIDVLARSRIPILKRAHVQFIPFADAGTTWGETRTVEGTQPPLEGEPRTSVGLGMRRTLWLPGLLALRLDVTRRTDRGDDAWDFWLRAVPIEP